METLSIRSRDARNRIEPHRAAWSRMEPHGAATSHCVNFKYYRSRMETLSIRSRDAWSRMELHGAAWSNREPPCKLEILQESYENPLN